MTSAIRTMAVGKVATAAIAWRYGSQLQVTAIVKATLAFAFDGPMPLVEPREIFADEVRHGRNPARSVRFASDLMPQQRRTDVMFTGYAHAPSKSSVASMRVRLALSDGHQALMDKSLLVQKNGGFHKMAITYENAFGGIGYPENPYGRGVDDEDEPPAILDAAQPRRAAGFGPLSRALATRKRLLGGSSPPNFGSGITTLATNIDWEYFQAAPEDQRIAGLRGDEQILLEGLHPHLPQAHLRLPGVRGKARVYGLSNSGVAEGAQLDMYANSLHISGDEELCLLTFRVSFPVASEEALGGLRIAAGVELQGAPMQWPDETAVKQSAGERKPANVAGAVPVTDATMALGDNEFEILLDDEPRAPGVSDSTSYLDESQIRPTSSSLPFQRATGNVGAMLPATPARGPAPDAGGTMFIDSGEEEPPRPAIVAPPAYVAPPAVIAPAVVMPAPAPVVAAEPAIAPKPVEPAAVVWAAQPAEPEAAKPKVAAPQKRPRQVAPPKFDVRAKLYGARIKSR